MNEKIVDVADQLEYKVSVFRHFVIQFSRNNVSVVMQAARAVNVFMDSQNGSKSRAQRRRQLFFVLSKKSHCNVAWSVMRLNLMPPT